MVITAIKKVEQNNVIDHDRLMVGTDCIHVKNLIAWMEEMSLKKMSYELRPGWQGASRECQGEDYCSADVGEILSNREKVHIAT